MAFDAGTIVARLDLEDSEFYRKLKAASTAGDAAAKTRTAKIEPEVPPGDVAAADAKLDEVAHEREVKITPRVDESAFGRIRDSYRRLDEQLTNDVRRRGGVLAGMLGGSGLLRGAAGIPGMIGGLFGGGGGGGAAGAAPGAAGQTASAAGPGFLGMGATPAMWIGGGAAASSLLPALGGVLGVAGGGAAGLAGAGFLGSQAISQNLGPALQAYQQAQNAMQMAVTPQQRQQAQRQMQGAMQFAQRSAPGGASVFRSITGLQNDWQNFTGSLLPMLAKPLRQIVPMVESLFGPLRKFFQQSMTVVEPFVRALTGGIRAILPLLGNLARISGPGFAQLTTGLLLLVKNILPGLTTITKASLPFMHEFAGILGGLGQSIGRFFAVMAPAVGPSMTVLKALFQALGGILVLLGRVGAIMARALAPVIVAFAQTIKILEPPLLLVGKILAELAGAILQDLMSMLIPVAHLIADLAPTFGALAKVLASVFNVLENSGTIWNVFADALESLARPLANLINALVTQLAPFIPPLMRMIGALADGAVMILVRVVSALVPPLVKVTEALLPPLLKIVQQLVPVINVLAQMFAAGLATALVAILDALAPLVVLLAKLIGWVVGVVAAVVTWMAHFHLLIPVLIAVAAAIDPVGTAVLGLIAVIGFLSTHWHQVWNDIKSWTMDAWNFLTHGWGQWLVPGLTLIRLAVEFVRDHWKQAWDDITGAAQAAWNFIDNNIVQPMEQVFTQDLPNAFGTAVRWIGQHWQDIENVVASPVKFVIDHVLDGLISAFDWITSKLGLGRPIGAVHPMGLARGGRLPGYGGGDRHPALLESGETVVSKEHSGMLADVFRAVGVPGYQAGGRFGALDPSARYAQRPAHNVGQHGPGLLGGIGHFFSGLWHKAEDVGKITAAVATGNTAALTNAIMNMLGTNLVGGATAEMAQMLMGMGKTAVADAVKWLIGHGGMGADGNAIVKFAMSYLGKIPYTWGGTSLSGDDCSGFVEDVYNHFGIHPPRTSEAQYAWAKRSGPVPGGLAFYVSAGGGPPPGHVAIIRTPTQVISQGGPEGVKGPTLMPLHGMPLMGTGIPPGGLGGVGLGPQNLRQIEGYWMQAGGPGGMVAHIAAAITGAEAGFRPGAIQQGQPYATTGWGLWQITPGNSEPQFGINQALLNPLNNARAAVAKWRAAGGFSPWTTYTSGAYQRFMDSGGWLLPGLNVNANATGRPEAVLNPVQSSAFVAMAEAAHQLSKQGGGGHSLLRDVHLTLPEGTTVTQALQELSWMLRVSRQQAYTGVS